MFFLRNVVLMILAALLHAEFVFYDDGAESLRIEVKNFCRDTLFFLVALFLIAASSPVLSYDVIVPDTGQDLCYNWERIICDEWHMEGFDQICDSKPYCPEPGENFYGQDANYTINPPDLTDNGDGTVSDNLTGLLWEQKMEENDFLLYTYQDAITYCKNLSLGENEDWRVPTRKEYVNLLNLGRLSPALDTNYFPFFIRTANDDIYYWTSTDYYDDPTQVWVMQLSFGIIEPQAKDQTRKIRCVSGSTEPATSFTDNDNGTVTDNVTDLLWEQKTNDGSSRDKDETHTWLEALNYCEELVLGGFSDWRLPTPKELERMIDLSTSNPAADTTYFPNTTNGLYWTGSTCVGCHKFKAFAYDFSDGELYFGIKKVRNEEVFPEHYTRCVRTAVSSCPTEEIYGAASLEAQLLRSFRDTILDTTPEGKELIKLYNNWSCFLVEVIRNDEELKAQVKETVDKILQVIDSRE
jgi:hypothetical protein